MTIDTTNPIKLGEHPRILCKIPNQECLCADGTCNNALLMLVTCSVCGETAAGFDCSKPGCPVNGGSARG